MRQTVVSVVPPGASLFEASTPAGVWASGRTTPAGLNIEFISCSTDDTVVELDGGLTMAGLERLDDWLERADVLVIPTWPIETTEVPATFVSAIREAHQNGTTLVGLCLGAFAVAATGLLDGSSAVTHWRHRHRFESMFPDVTFEPDTLYVDHGQIVTSAGSAAAMDCCLHLVRRDHGAEAAAAIARSLVTAPHRGGTQSQFAAAPPILGGTDDLSRALGAASHDIASIVDVSSLADLAGLGRRSLERRMRDRLGVSPKEWIAEQRVITACRLLEQPDPSIEHVAQLAGYGSAPSLRRAFKQRRSTTPTRYRAMFISSAE